MGKRPLGLGKSKKQKKQKLGNDGVAKGAPADPSSSNQIEIALEQDVDVDDELVQLKGLWDTFLKDKDNQLLLNGVVHECDRLLREQEEGTTVLNDIFHSIYAQALSELTVFSGEEDNETKRYKLINDFFEAALERYTIGLEKYPDSSVLPLVNTKIILQRIPLQYISQIGLEDTNDEKYKLHELLETAKSSFSIAKGHEQLAYENLLSFYDLLDIVETFEDKEELEDGLDSDDDEDLLTVVLHENHPLTKIKKNMTTNYEWLRANLQALFKNLARSTSAEDGDKSLEINELYISVARTLGQLYLRLAEEPSKAFAELMYDSDEEEQDEGSLLQAKKAQDKAIPLVKSAIKYLEEAKEEDDPQTWVDVAEAIIDLGNLYDFESKDQEESYNKAEIILQKANKATHGKYKVILDNLLNKE